MKMKLRECFLLTITMLWKLSSSLRCYRCKPQIENYSTDKDQLCQHFDYGDNYVVNCEHSTMCYKREITSNLGNGFKIYERDCAQQLLSGDQVRTAHGWDSIERIYEVYEEGCQESPQRAEMVTKTVHCYCRGDLCNGGLVVTSGGLLFVMIGLLAVARIW